MRSNTKRYLPTKNNDDDDDGTKTQREKEEGESVCVRGTQKVTESE